ncbi:hypothetical protein I551_7961 [Mycobacterium ulcerans str. Harvey]|uniref:Uncharacterized protein n=1 Tax=Mycobacterium ulcerans str. Harvey TaxID=1299332 RepID=A0ABN0QLF3_MYCUL|nr:hypothetical protein I551_7961 [Mycobacterium ulcerans str. Harvey]
MAPAGIARSRAAQAGMVAARCCWATAATAVTVAPLVPAARQAAAATVAPAVCYSVQTG